MEQEKQQEQRTWYVLTLFNGQLLFVPSDEVLDQLYAGEKIDMEMIPVKDILMLKRQANGIGVVKYQDEVYEPEGIMKMRPQTVATISKLQKRDFVKTLEDTLKLESSVVRNILPANMSIQP